MYKIYTGLNEYYLSEQNPSDTNIPNEIYDRVYGTSEGYNDYFIDINDLNKLSVDQVYEIRTDIDRDLDAMTWSENYNDETRYRITNCKLCLNIINTYLNIVYNKNFEVFCG